jgi:pimeloyl-ACP methyl ester carboxylesterase
MEFTKHTADFGRGLASWYEGDGDGEEICFLAANGFPVGSYRFLSDEFGKGYRVVALENRGAWPEQPLPQGRSGWQGHADDLIAFLEYRRDQGLGELPVWGMGHSIGGTVNLLAAAKRPELFKGLVLIDPATVPSRILPLLGGIGPWLMAQTGLVKSTANRRPRWQSPEAFAEYHREKSVYRRFRPQAMSDYAVSGLVPAEDGQYRLRFSREWEAWNFQHTPFIWQALKKVRCPVLLLRAEYSNLHPEREFRRRQRGLPSHVIARDIPGVGHMAFQEDPQQVVAMIREGLEAMGSNPTH